MSRAFFATRVSLFQIKVVIAASLKVRLRDCTVLPYLTSDTSGVKGLTIQFPFSSVVSLHQIRSHFGLFLSLLGGLYSV